MAPVARLDHERLAQRGARLFHVPLAGQRVAQRRPAFAQRGVEFGGASPRGHRGGQCSQIGRVVDARRLEPEDVGVGEARMGSGVRRRALDGAAERLGGAGEGIDVE